jgi:hypothetical protein
MTRTFVEDLEILQNIGFGRSFKPMPGLDVIHMVVVPRNKPATPTTPATISVVHPLS